MKNLLTSRWFKIPYFILLYAFAFIGFGLTAVYFAIYFKWTNESGAIDQNSRYLNAIHSSHSKNSTVDKLALTDLKLENFRRIAHLRNYYPLNASQILEAHERNVHPMEIKKMLDVADFRLSENKEYTKGIVKLKHTHLDKSTVKKGSVYEWMNSPEWETFTIAVEKDKKIIDSVANVTGVEARLIVACLVGEQIRLFNTDREGFKQWIGPLKVLSVESKFSLGVTGIKDFTAARIEGNLRDKSSVFYLGEAYEHLLDFKTENIEEERYERLTNFRNHYYSYMYAALFLKQVKQQWQAEGYPIDDRPEILATLFNVGFPQSKPKINPQVGGSTIIINNVSYTFGMIAYQFYYSGELLNLFLIQQNKFDWVNKNEPRV